MDLTIYNKDIQARTEVGFLKAIKTQKRIDLAKFEYGYKDILIKVLIKIHYHTKIKDPVRDADKDDIIKMLETTFKHLSLDEIRKAFELERYGGLGEKTKHFQVFDAEYVATVLRKYQKWKAQKLKHHNITSKPIDMPLNEDEKRLLLVTGSLNLFKEFKKENRIVGVYVHIYAFIYALNVLPKHTAEFKKDVLEKAKAVLIFESKQKGVKKSQIDKEIENMSNESELKLICKRLILDRYFRDLIEQETELSEVLDKIYN